MRRLRERFPDELVVLGVHSAKFPLEQLTANIREAVLRHDIQHPVINDAGFQVWRQYDIRAWPTVALIDPLGNYVGAQPGEIAAEDFIPVLQEMIADFDRQGHLDRRPLDLRPEAAAEPARPLAYPSKLLAAPADRLFVADTGHHRILELRLDAEGLAGEVLRVFGSGRAGFEDGPAASAAFRSPHGLALEGSSLYVADTDNHAVRAIDLESGTVRTVAGTGEKARDQFHLGSPTETSLRSPWALAALGDELLFIAMAGSHQIWVLLNAGGHQPGEPLLGPFAGNGREALVDGPRAEASFNQPSDVAVGMGHLFVADAEASAIRAVGLDAEPKVITLVGQGLFEFGDVDGAGGEVRLQHPTGIAHADGSVYVADSYNHKIKRLDPTTGRVETLMGTGWPGASDGPLAQAELYQPEGVSVSGRRLYIADTNNHLIRVADLKAGTLRTLRLHGLERLPSRPVEEQVGVRLPPVKVAPGQTTLTLDIELPPGFKLNPEAPLTLSEVRDGAVRTFAAPAAPALTVEVGADRDLLLDLTAYYCQAGDERICLIHTARLVLPLVADEGGRAAVRVPYRVLGPEQRL